MENEFLKQWFLYEPDKGILRCLIPGRDPYPWLPVGKDLRYRIVNVGQGKYYLHRLIWQYHHGRVPLAVDHIDGDTFNNKIENLRECNNAKNQYNSKRKITNRAGHKGVVFHKACLARPWQAKITVNKKIISLGYYSTAEEAGAAYWKGAQMYAGEFARKD